MVTYLLLGLAISVSMPVQPSAPTRSLAPAPPISSAQARNTISGLVFSPERRPVPQLYVELMNDLESVISVTRTTGGGRYVFDNLNQGVYQVRVRTQGTNYVSQTKRVNIINFTSNVPNLGTVTSGAEYVQLDFNLQADEANPLPAITGTIFVQDVPAEAKKAYDKGIAELDGGKNEPGYAELKRAIEIFPNYYQALERLGTEYVKRGYYQAASILLRKAVDVNPRSYSSMFSLGLSQYNLKQLSLAIETFRRAAALAPASPYSHLWLGTVLRQAGKLDQAEAPLKRAKELSKNQVSEAPWQLALLYNQLKRYREAAAELELFLKTAPNARDQERIKKLIIQLRNKMA